MALGLIMQITSYDTAGCFLVVVAAWLTISAVWHVERTAKHDERREATQPHQPPR